MPCQWVLQIQYSLSRNNIASMDVNFIFCYLEFNQSYWITEIVVDK